MVFEQLTRSNAFDDLYNALGRERGDGLYKKMHMVFVRPDFKKMYFVAFRNLKADSPQRFVDCFGEYHTPVLRGADNVVQQY